MVSWDAKSVTIHRGTTAASCAGAADVASVFFLLSSWLALAASGLACARGTADPRTAVVGVVSPAPPGAVRAAVGGQEAVGGQAPAGATAHVAPPPAPEPPLALRWSPDGARLAVGDHWLLDPERGRYSRLACPFTGEGAAAACGAGAASFSPDGARVLFVGGEDLAIIALPAAGLADGGPPVHLEIPRWARARSMKAATYAAERGDLINVAFWLSPRAVLVQQFDRSGELATVCRLLAVSAARPKAAPSSTAPAWTRPRGGCIDADFHQLTRVDPGPDGWLALHSAGEGGFALGVVRYTPERGQSAARPTTPSVDIDGAGTLWVRFARDGASLDLLSPCDLSIPPHDTGKARATACADPFAEPTWKLYTRALPAGPLRLRRADLPRGAAVHPAGDRFAWPQGDSVCIGDPAGPAAPPCFPLPRD